MEGTVRELAGNAPGCGPDWARWASILPRQCPTSHGSGTNPSRFLSSASRKFRGELGTQERPNQHTDSEATCPWVSRQRRGDQCVQGRGACSWETGVRLRALGTVQTTPNQPLTRHGHVASQAALSSTAVSSRQTTEDWALKGGPSIPKALEGFYRDSPQIFWGWSLGRTLLEAAPGNGKGSQAASCLSGSFQGASQTCGL